MREKVKTPTGIRHSPMEHPRHQYPMETEALQEIARSCGLAEALKWGKPCFMFAGKNVVLIQRFNQYIALMFFKGALLSDPEKLLQRVGEHMQAPRQLRFETVAEIVRLRPRIEGFLREAIRLEEAGTKLQRAPREEPVLPEELLQRMEADAVLKRAFAALTPGRQRGYVYQIAASKQASTRASRVEKFVPQILAGKGWNE